MSEEKKNAGRVICHQCNKSVAAYFDKHGQRRIGDHKAPSTFPTNRLCSGAKKMPRWN